MKVFAVISARGISGGLPRKNLYPLLGRPMLDYALEALRESRVIDRTYVFTEDDEIARVTEAAGGVVVPRTKDQLFYAGGFSPPSAWAEHIRSFIERDLGPPQSWVSVNMNCNLCLVTGETIARMFFTLMEHDSATQIEGVTRVEPHLFTVNPSTGLLFPVWHDPGLDRQQYPPLVRTVGIGVLHHQRQSWGTHPKRLCHEMPPWEALDVQTEDDVEMAEYFLSRRGRSRGTRPASAPRAPAGVDRVHAAVPSA